MSLAATIRDGCNRLVVENDIAFINTIQFDAVSCKETSYIAKVVILFELDGKYPVLF